MKNVRRRPTGRVVGLLMLALVLVACGSDDDDTTSTPTSGGTGARIDSQLVFGGPPECIDRPFCLGTTSQQLYGLKFKEVKRLDVGGPITAKALKDGEIQVGILFTGSSVIDPDFVLLTDDKELQPADNAIALVREDAATDDVKEIIDAVNAKLTLAAYNKMATGITEDKLDPEDVAKTFLEENDLLTAGTSGDGKSLTVGAANFAGARAISQAYAQALEAKGYDITFRDNIGTREQTYPLLEKGDLDLYGEFTGTLLTYLEGTPTGDPDETFQALNTKLQGTGLVATTPAEAQDVNGFYVTKATADKYGLVNVSDLTKNG
jgi:glycine betaine/choline ABC-type transport system substrate-binding protein